MPIPNSKGNPFIGGYIYTGGRKNWRFSMEMAAISEMVQDRMMVTMEC